MTRSEPANTITQANDDSARRGKPPTVALLYLALDCERLSASSTRHGLGEVDEVVIGRAEGPTTSRGMEQGSRRLSLGLPDRWLSGTHARLSRVLGKWMLEDANSKNGTFVNGARITRAELTDGDVVEAGHVFFVFRTGEELPREAPRDVDATSLPSTPFGLRTLIPSLAERFAMLTRIAPSDVSVIVHGESGTGKELVARGLHELSGRPGPFVAVNCGALPAALVEGELFGHKKGAFSGAVEDRPGLVRTAHRGTLFLDEIGDLPISAQPAFLRVLQEHEVVPIGGTQPVRVDVRLVCATHRDLDALVTQGKFRADLLARLSGFTLRLPPLRERHEELGMIASDLLARIAPKRAQDTRFTLDAGRALMRHDWPLNVRELEKCLGAAVVLAGDDRIEENHLADDVRGALDLVAAAPIDPDDDPKEIDKARRPLSPAEEQHREELVALFREHEGNISAVARKLGKARVQIQRWIKRYDLDPTSFR